MKRETRGDASNVTGGGEDTVHLGAVGFDDANTRTKNWLLSKNQMGFGIVSDLLIKRQIKFLCHFQKLVYRKKKAHGRKDDDWISGAYFFTGFI